MIYQKSSCNGLLHIDLIVDDQEYFKHLERRWLLFEKKVPAEGSLAICIEFKTGPMPALKLKEGQ